MNKEIKPVEKAAITALDVRIVVAAAICCLCATLCKTIGFEFVYGEKRLEILQKMTACIACLLCCQDTTQISLKAGKNRLIITVIGGLVGIGVTAIDMIVGNQWVLVGLIAAGILGTLWLCKVAKVPYINARIGGVTFILVACTMNGNARMWYALFRFVSTFFGVLVVLLVTWCYDFGKSRMHKGKQTVLENGY